MQSAVLLILTGGKNKGRSIEGKLVLFTKILAIAFIVIAAILNINF